MYFYILKKFIVRYVAMSAFTDKDLYTNKYNTKSWEKFFNVSAR